MSIKLKALGLGLLAVLATSAFAMNASAKVSGHFVSEVHHGILSGTGTATHFTDFSVDGGTGIRCTSESYSGTISRATTEEETTTTTVTVTPSYSNCETTGSVQNWDVHENGCNYKFWSASSGDGTVDVVCPEGAAFVITHPNCTITVPAQTPTGGVGYTNIEHPSKSGKHAITVTATASNITAHYHGGACIFLGTKHTAEMKGSVIVTAANTAGEQKSITAT